jgi:hypothetical protein
MHGLTYKADTAMVLSNQQQERIMDKEFRTVQDAKNYLASDFVKEMEGKTKEEKSEIMASISEKVCQIPHTFDNLPGITVLHCYLADCKAGESLEVKSDLKRMMA